MRGRPQQQRMRRTLEAALPSLPICSESRQWLDLMVQVWELRKASLPPGEGGADAVERQRARRAFEAALPSLTDLRRHPLRCVGGEGNQNHRMGPEGRLAEHVSLLAAWCTQG